jgi:hypothetical protein
MLDYIFEKNTNIKCCYQTTRTMGDAKTNDEYLNDISWYGLPISHFIEPIAVD